MTLPKHEERRLRQVCPSDQLRLSHLIERRKAGYPLQYLEGSVQFGPVELMVDRRALIPRPETEVLWEMAVAAVHTTPPTGAFVDLCTGSGNLALALRHAFPTVPIFATDLSSAALELAGENTAGHDIVLCQGDLFQALPDELRGRISLLTANPPYVSEAEYRWLPAEIRDHEPRQALVGGMRGDEVIAAIAAHVAEWLAPGGWLFCEIGETQADRALELFADLDAEVRHDLTDRPRVLAARKSL